MDKYLGRFTSDNANYIITAEEDGPLWVKLCQPPSSMFPIGACRSISRGEWKRLVDKKSYHSVTVDDERKIGGNNREPL